MKDLSILIVGGGIGGLTSAIALRQRGFAVEVIEKDPDWSVYGVGIIQQANVVRAVAELGIVDDYLDAGFGYDHVEIYKPDGELAAKIPSPRLVESYPAQMGIGRRALQKVLADRTRSEGAEVRLGIVVTELNDAGNGVDVTLSDGSSKRYDIVIGADGIYSQMREILFPDAPTPQFAGQSVWRYNFSRPDKVAGLHVYQGPGGSGIGLMPLSDELMYMFVTTPEPDNSRYPRKGLAKRMREYLKYTAPQIMILAEQITDDDGVVYKPMEWLLLNGDWHKGRSVLIGDAVHATTPHLGQGAGMAIEDSVVLAEELGRADTPRQAFTRFQQRRFDRCKYIVESSLAICAGQVGRGPLVNQAEATAEMFRVTSQPI